MHTATDDDDPSHAPAQRTLAVVPEQRDRWQAALIRGTANRLDVRSDGAGLSDDGGDVHRYQVSSLSKPGTWHRVTVGKPSPGAHWAPPVAACDCEAGRVPIPCMHAAIALDLANAWPVDMPILRQPHLAAPAPTYRTGDRVRVLASGARGIVDYSALPNGRDWLYLLRSTRGNVLGAFLASQLEPADAPDAHATAAPFMAKRRAS